MGSTYFLSGEYTFYEGGLFSLNFGWGMQIPGGEWSFYPVGRVSVGLLLRGVLLLIEIRC